MNTRTVDLANIFLMLFSCALAFAVPFELFLFSYAVLGPLHYLTEIGWLRKRDYFANGKKDYIVLVAPCLVLTFVNLLGRYHQLPVISDMYNACLSVFGDNFLSVA